MHVDAGQKQRLAWRPKHGGKPFSPELRDVADLYLDVPVENEPELGRLAKTANHAADRKIKNGDETVG